MSIEAGGWCGVLLPLYRVAKKYNDVKLARAAIDLVHSDFLCAVLAI